MEGVAVPLWFTALLMGTASAASLPLGALTALVWTPRDRVIAVLMSFGGGALLAALTIDLVGSALSQGHFNALAAGCVAGGLLFVALNEVVNDYGGFLRKASTTYYHLRRQDHRRFRRLLAGLGRVDVFRELPVREFRALAGSIKAVAFARGARIFEPGEPARNLYVLAQGEIELVRIGNPERPTVPVPVNDAFGWMAFLTGSPHTSTALVRAPSTVWSLPRESFLALLANSPTLLQAVHRWIRSYALLSYLEQDQGMSSADARAWADRAVDSLGRHGSLPQTIPARRRSDIFIAGTGHVTGPPHLAGLPEDEVRLLATLVISRRWDRGEALFQEGDLADRLFVVEEGRVSLLDPRHSARRPPVLGPWSALGGASFVAGGRHTMSAVATEPVRAWSLRRQDLEGLLPRLPHLSLALQAYARGPELLGYLIRRQGLARPDAAPWTQAAGRSLAGGRMPVPVIAHGVAGEERPPSPLAIWAGILLDGIPESVVIGASLANSQLGLALLVALFLSNYPEALSSSVGMREKGLGRGRVLAMWISIAVLTGIGAALGNAFFVGASPVQFAVVEGVAAGAMLTMIAQTMLPEAYLKGGSVVGLSTLFGFLCAIFFKTLE